MNERKIRAAVRSYLLSEGFKIGDLTSVDPGGQIPLSWDLDDIHFVRKSEDGGAYTSDKKFSSEFGGVFPIRSAFAFQQNAPSRDNAAYPSHLEDVLEALKGKKNTVYTVPERDMQAYIADGTRIIARSIVDDIDDRIRAGTLPAEVKEARISIYATPSSSTHVQDYIEGLRSSLESYIGSRISVKKEAAKSSVARDAYKQCADKVKKKIEAFNPGDRLGTFRNFTDLYSRQKYEEAVKVIQKQLLPKYKDSKANPDKYLDVTKAFYKSVLLTIQKTDHELRDFESPDVYPTFSDIDVNRSFSKIPVAQDPRIQADATIRSQFENHINTLNSRINPPSAGEPAQEFDGVDLSKVQNQHLEGLSTYIRKRWKGWQKRAVPDRLTVNDLIQDFEIERQGDIPNWRKRMLAAKKTDFSISVVPSQNRRHVADFIEADTETLPTFTHIAIIADDNMESGITLREMRRVFERIRGQSNPPLIVYGAPLLMIRGQDGRESTHEKNYTGRRKSKLPVAAPLSNIPENTELYKRIIDRLAAMGNPEFELAEPEEESGENRGEDQR